MSQSCTAVMRLETASNWNLLPIRTCFQLEPASITLNNQPACSQPLSLTREPCTTPYHKRLECTQNLFSTYLSVKHVEINSFYMSNLYIVHTNLNRLKPIQIGTDQSDVNQQIVFHLMEEQFSLIQNDSYHYMKHCTMARNH